MFIFSTSRLFKISQIKILEYILSHVFDVYGYLQLTTILKSFNSDSYFQQLKYIE